MADKGIKYILLLVSILLSFSNAAEAQITRGASYDEIYISTFWYQDNNGIMHSAIFHSLDNGENLEKKYNNFTPAPSGEMSIEKILSDATPGVLYNFGSNKLWVSYDHGENWVHENSFTGYSNYLSGIVEGTIYKTGGSLSKSEDFGQTFEVITEPISIPINEIGYSEGEFYGINGNAGIEFTLVCTHDFANTFFEIPIDSSVAFWAPGGNWPKVFRGSESGELYLVSWWPGTTFKIFHSVDSGFNWTQKYESEIIDLYSWGVHFSAGIIPGSFYVKRSTLNSTLDHTLLYLDYSDDYGESFTTYFHDLDSTITSLQGYSKNFVEFSNHPNPFETSTIIRYQLKEASNISLEIRGIIGDVIQTIDLGYQTKGIHYRKIENIGATWGIYFATIIQNKIPCQTIKLIKGQ